MAISRLYIFTKSLEKYKRTVILRKSYRTRWSIRHCYLSVARSIMYLSGFTLHSTKWPTSRRTESPTVWLWRTEHGAWWSLSWLQVLTRLRCPPCPRVWPGTRGTLDTVFRGALENCLVKQNLLQFKLTFYPSDWRGLLLNFWRNMKNASCSDLSVGLLKWS